MAVASGTPRQHFHRSHDMMKKTAAKPSPAGKKKKAAAEPSAVKRRHLRFRPDPMEYAQIAVRDLGAPFTPEMVALVSEEAPMGGCGLVLMETPLLKVGDICRVKVGRIDPLRAQVMWRQAVESGIIRLGLKFLE
jgi:hypothetical protein